MHFFVKIILSIVLFVLGILSLGLWPYIPGKYPGGVAISIVLFLGLMFGIYRLWKMETTGTTWMNLDKVSSTFKTEKWYNNNWIIALCLLFWPLGLFLTIRKIFIVLGYYNVETKKFQNPNMRSNSTKQQDLDKLKETGVLTEEEYTAKQKEIENDIKKKDALDALERAHASGVLTDEEYETKLNQIEQKTI